MLVDIDNDKEELNKKEQYLFESKSLFFKDVSYRLSDLQKFLGDQGISMKMLNKKLYYDTKVEIYMDKGGDLQMMGQLCSEYLEIRRLIYDHFEKV